MSPTSPKSSGLRKFLMYGTAAVLVLGAAGYLVYDRYIADHSFHLPKPETYVSTPVRDKNLDIFVSNVSAFMLLHEMGHLVFSQYDVAIGSQDTNESAADSFAAALLSHKTNNPDAGNQAMVAAAYYFQGRSYLYPADLADEHEPDAARAAKLACLAVGSDPKRYYYLMAQFNLKSEAYCEANARKTRQTWIGTLQQYLNPGQDQVGNLDTPNVAVIAKPTLTIKQRLETFTGQAESADAQTMKDLEHARDLTQKSDALDFVANTILELKTPRASTDDLARSGSRTVSPALRMLNPVGTPPDPRGEAPKGGHVEHPFADDPMGGYNYVLVGDDCPVRDDKGAIKFEKNAFWNEGTRRITFCYMFAKDFEDIGKSWLMTDQKL